MKGYAKRARKEVLGKKLQFCPAERRNAPRHSAKGVLIFFGPKVTAYYCFVYLKFLI